MSQPIKRKPLTEEQKQAARERSKRYYYANREKKKAYQRQYNKEHRAGIRRLRKDNDADGVSLIGWIKHKFEGMPCLDCSGVFPWIVMDFDHRPDEKKEFTISRGGNLLATSERIAKWMKEISKCDLVCSNCHRIRTGERYSGE